MKYHQVLTDTKLRAAKPKDKPYKLADGEGLYVLIMPTGAMYWRYNYRFEGVAKTMAIGTYPILSLKVARKAHAEAMATVQLGGDPMAEKKEIKEEKKRQATFREIAAEWLTVKVPEHKRSEKTHDRDVRMVKYLNAEIGDVALGDLTVKSLSDVLVKYEAAGKFETRVRVQGAAISIAGFAVGRGHIKINPFLGVNYADAFTAPANESRPAVTTADAFGRLLRKMSLHEGRDDNLTGIALELAALTFVRPGDVIAAQWAHFDLDKAKWSVPPEELKMRTKRKENKSPRAGKPHEVPLARQTITLLQKLHKLTGTSTHLFPGRQSARTMSENTMRDALIAMGYKDVHCPHGFRSSASTLLNEERIDVGDRRVFLWEEQPALIEVQLDHDDASTRAIYARGGKWEERVELMQHWADCIDRLRFGNTPAQKSRLSLVA